MSSKRNDIHSPSNLVTENYEYVNSFDTQQPMWLANEYAQEVSSKVRKTNRDRGMTQCHHCGAYLRYVAVLEHVPTGDYIAVGETCLENRFDRATADFHALRKQAQLDREQQKIRKAVEAFVAENPDLAFMGIKKHEARMEAMPTASQGNWFIHDVANKLNRYGSLSEKQVAAVRTACARDAEAALRRAQIEAEKAHEVKVPVVEGKQQITGTVLSVKWQDNDFGGSLKMLVKDDRGFKVWGTVPKSLPNCERDDRVIFSATVTKSEDDEAFGFFSRPTKGVFLNTKEEAA